MSEVIMANAVNEKDIAYNERILFLLVLIHSNKFSASRIRKKRPRYD